MTQTTTPTLPNHSANVDWQFIVGNDKAACEMLAAAQEFANSIRLGAQPHWLSILGKSGIGKTHLARQLYRWFWQKGCKARLAGKAGEITVERTSRFVRWRQTADELRSGKWGEVQSIIDREFVVLDDIGAEHQGGTGAVKSALERILDERIGKWTVITSNLYLPQIAEQLDTRIASRMRRLGNIVVSPKEARDFNARKI